MLLAIGLQESRFLYRAQKIAGQPYMKGPARGFWQEERGGGVHGVMIHPATKDLAQAICKERGVPFDSVLIHARLETDDILAAAFARLLLWADSKPLPGGREPRRSVGLLRAQLAPGQAQARHVGRLPCAGARAGDGMSWCAWAASGAWKVQDWRHDAQRPRSWPRASASTTSARA
jgi:hypothetical protein